MDVESVLHDLFNNSSYNSVQSIFDRVKTLFEETVLTSEKILSDFVDRNFLEDVRNISNRGNDRVFLFLSKNLRKVKCMVRDDNDREHLIFIEYLGVKELIIKEVNLPPELYHDQVYSSLERLVDDFIAQIASLEKYFNELEKIDKVFKVVEPVVPSFKIEQRKIVLAPRVWLHLEVTREGTAVNMHIIGNKEWEPQLLDGMKLWHPDDSIASNVQRIFDLPTAEFSPNSDSALDSDSPPLSPYHEVAATSMDVPMDTSDIAPNICDSDESMHSKDGALEENKMKEVERDIENDEPKVEVDCDVFMCYICLTTLSPEGNKVALPLCPKKTCNAYYHRDCLFNWLQDTSGARASSLGVATGNTPCCNLTVSCTNRDM